MKYTNIYTETLAKWNDRVCDYVEVGEPLIKIEWESEDEDYELRSKYLEVLYDIKDKCPEKITSYSADENENVCNTFVIELGKGKALIKQLDIIEIKEGSGK